MAIKIQLRRGTAAEWTSANTVLSAGEIGVETDTNKFKIGTGTASWSDLEYPLDSLYLTQNSASSIYATISSPSFSGSVDFASATLYSTSFSGSADFTNANVTGIDSLPTQAGNSGKILTTNGTTASWQFGSIVLGYSTYNDFQQDFNTYNDGYTYRTYCVSRFKQYHYCKYSICSGRISSVS
jgi:hypothetical protein